jgi:hypothetical protein
LNMDAEEQRALAFSSGHWSEEVALLRAARPPAARTGQRAKVDSSKYVYAALASSVAHDGANYREHQNRILHYSIIFGEYFEIFSRHLVSWVKADRFPIRCLRLGVALDLAQDDAEVRFEADRFPACRFRLGVTPRFKQNIAELVMSWRIFEIYTEGISACGFRFEILIKFIGL